MLINGVDSIIFIFDFVVVDESDLVFPKFGRLMGIVGLLSPLISGQWLDAIWSMEIRVNGLMLSGFVARFN